MMMLFDAQTWSLTAMAASTTLHSWVDRVNELQIYELIDE